MKIRYQDEYYGESVKDLSGTIAFLRGTRGEPGIPGSAFHDSTLNGTGSVEDPLSVSRPVPSGLEGQMLSFDADGNPVSINIPQVGSNDILTKLKEVDSDSSGLNSDLVHGVRGTRIEKVAFLGSLKTNQTINVGWSTLELTPIFDPYAMYNAATKTLISNNIPQSSISGTVRRYVVKLQINVGAPIKNGVSKLALGYKNASTKHIIDISRSTLDEIITRVIDTPRLSFTGGNYNGISLDTVKVFNFTGSPIIIDTSQDNQLMAETTTVQISYYDLL